MYSVGPIDAEGAFTADFALPAEVPMAQVPVLIERDRAVMATRAGMRQKHLPVAFDRSTGNFLSGGRYLFDTFENALAYRDWVERDFIVDGTRFFERPFFINPVYCAWHVIGAEDFKPIADCHKAIRFERWDVPVGAGATLEQAWGGIRDAAQSRDLASVWLLHSPECQQVGLVTVADAGGRGGAADPDGLDFLESSPSLGMSLDDRILGAKGFDRSSWVLTIWFPVRAGEPVPPALWPNSPPLPAPVPAAV